MTDKRSLDARFRKWHVSEEATIAHLVRSLAPEAPQIDPRVHGVLSTKGIL